MIEKVERNRREPKKDTRRVRIVLLSTAGARIQGKWSWRTWQLWGDYGLVQGAVDQVSKAFPALLPPKSLCLAQDWIGQQQLSLSGGRRVVGVGSEWGVLDTILPFAAMTQPILNRRVDGRTSIKHRDQRECEGPQR